MALLTGCDSSENGDATADGDVLFVVEALGTETRRDFTLEVSIVE